MGSRDRELFDLLREVVAAQGVDLVEVSLGGARSGALVRIVITSRGGISHADCARVTEACERALERDPSFSGSHTLEVSSPGTDRVLRGEHEFELFRGRRVRVWLSTENTPRERAGTCAGFRAGEGVVLRDEEGAEIVIPWDAIGKARLVPEDPGGAKRIAGSAKHERDR